MRLTAIVPQDSPPSVTVSGVLPSGRPLEVRLKHVAHAPAERLVVVRLEVVARQLDTFAEPLAGRIARFSRVVTLPGLKGKKLKGYRVLVLDQEDNNLGSLVWP